MATHNGMKTVIFILESNSIALGANSRLFSSNNSYIPRIIEAIPTMINDSMITLVVKILHL